MMYDIVYGNPKGTKISHHLQLGHCINCKEAMSTHNLGVHPYKCTKKIYPYKCTKIYRSTHTSAAKTKKKKKVKKSEGQPLQVQRENPKVNPYKYLHVPFAIYNYSVTDFRDPTTGNILTLHLQVHACNKSIL